MLLSCRVYPVSMYHSILELLYFILFLFLYIFLDLIFLFLLSNFLFSSCSMKRLTYNVTS